MTQSGGPPLRSLWLCPHPSSRWVGAAPGPRGQWGTTALSRSLVTRPAMSQCRGGDASQSFPKQVLGRLWPHHAALAPGLHRAAAARDSTHGKPGCPLRSYICSLEKRPGVKSLPGSEEGGPGRLVDPPSPGGSNKRHFHTLTPKPPGSTSRQRCRAGRETWGHVPRRDDRDRTWLPQQPVTRSGSWGPQQRRLCLPPSLPETL